MKKNAKVSEESVDNINSPQIIFNNYTDGKVKIEQQEDGSTDVNVESTNKKYGVSETDKPVTYWDINDWREEFKCWMKKRDAWDAYDAVEDKTSELDKIDDIKEFISQAFIWSKNEETFKEIEWYDINRDWEGHIRELEGGSIMGVDYDGVGGVGIKLTDSDISAFIDNKVFTQEEWDDDWYECLEKLPVSFESAGDYCYSGDDPTIYLLLEGNTIDELYGNVPIFLEELNKLGLERTREDIKVVEDIKVW